MEKRILPLVCLLASISSQLARAIPLKHSPPAATASPERNFNSTRITELIKSNGNDTIDDLVQKQTNTIKQIVSNQQSLLNYPSVTKYPTQEHQNHQNSNDKKEQKTKAESESEKLTLEELKIKCQHLAQLAAGGNVGIKPATTTTTTTNHNVNPFIDYNHLKLPRPSHIRPIGFYITTDAPPKTPTTTTTTTTTEQPPPSSTTTPSNQNVKLIKLEPVILVKTMLNDGRVIYNWHRSLPSAVQVEPASPPLPLPLPPTFPTTTTTTTTEASSGYDFRYFFPSFYSAGSAQSVDSSTTEKTTTPTPTTTAPLTPSTEIIDGIPYQQQLRFVIPVPYASPGDPVIKRPGDFDQFAYYPKQLQPETVNMEVPYVPTFHVINALMLPPKNENQTELRGLFKRTILK